LRPSTQAEESEARILLGDLVQSDAVSWQPMMQVLVPKESPFI
jgi:hypothetical protein